MRLLLILCLLASALPGRCEGPLEPKLGGVFDGSIKRPAAAVQAGGAQGLGLADLRPALKPKDPILLPTERFERKDDPDSERLRLLSIPLGLAAAGLASSLDLRQRDKLLHGSISAAGTYIGSDILQKAFGLKQWQATLISASVMMGAGVFKEYAMDSRPDPQDIKADAAGVLGGAGLKFLLTF